jgi:hypothetical protein
MRSQTASQVAEILVVEATGHLRGKVVDHPLAGNKQVRALIRPGTDATMLKTKEVAVARGDLTDRQSSSLPFVVLCPGVFFDNLLMVPNMRQSFKKYTADITTQKSIFGPPLSVEESLRRLFSE